MDVMFFLMFFFVLLYFDAVSSIRMHKTICFVMLLTTGPTYLLVLNGLEAVAAETLQILILRSLLREYKCVVLKVLLCF